MKILFLADEESKAFWDYYKPDYFEGIDLIISCGDVKASYLTFLVTMTSIPILYVRGNHDDKYEEQPPEGCICIEDKIYEYEGIKILGLGGSYRYKPGINQYTENEMKRRIRKLRFQLFQKKGFDILVTHAPAYGLHDGEDHCHQGFQSFLDLIEKYKPKIFAHGHVHMNYGRQFPREDMIGETKVVNAYQSYIIEI